MWRLRCDTGFHRGRFLHGLDGAQNQGSRENDAHDGAAGHQTRGDEADLAAAIRRGARRRPSQSFGCYYEGQDASCALGAAYEGMYRLTRGARPVVSRDLFRLFDCLDYTIRPCPDGGMTSCRWRTTFCRWGVATATGR